MAWLVVAVLCCLFLPACTKRQAPPNLLEPPEVLVTEVLQQDVPVIREWIGSLDGSVNADIRARVSGYLLLKEYKEGQLVHAGDLLFQIDPTTYQAALEQAKASLAQAEANQLQTEQAEKRMRDLFAQKVESAQNRDNAIQQNDAAKAVVKAQQAAVRQAEINLEFTNLKAPVTGIAGIANAGIGDLVSPSDAQPLVTISTVDPIKAYFQVSEQDYLKAQQNMQRDSTGKVLAPPVEMILSDGTLYGEKGIFSAVDRQVDAQTGTIRLAALFPNPQNILRPGQFVRVRVTMRTKHGALLVPQRAVNQLQASYEVAVVGPDNKATVRLVKVGELFGSLWVIEEGLQPGERIVVEGLQKVHDGELVKPMPWTKAAS